MAAKTKGPTAGMTRENKFFSRYWGESYVKNFDELVRLQSEKKVKWIRGVRNEKLPGAVDGSSSATPLANSLAVEFRVRWAVFSFFLKFRVGNKSGTCMTKLGVQNYSNFKDPFLLPRGKIKLQNLEKSIKFWKYQKLIASRGNIEVLGL